MKKRNIIGISTLSVLASSGTSARYANVQPAYQDGIYYSYTGSTKQEDLEAKEEVNALVQKTKSSEIFIDNGENATIYIPEDKSATITRSTEGTMTVTVNDTPDIFLSVNMPWMSWAPASYYWYYNDPWYYSPSWRYSYYWDWY